MKRLIIIFALVTASSCVQKPAPLEDRAFLLKDHNNTKCDIEAFKKSSNAERAKQMEHKEHKKILLFPATRGAIVDSEVENGSFRALNIKINKREYIRAATSGRIMSVKKSIHGSSITMQYKSGVMIHYEKLGKIFVSKGHKISQGEVLASHSKDRILRFSVQRNGQYIDPTPLIRRG